MNDIIIWIISIGTLIISYKLFSKAAGTINIRYFNTVTYVFYYCVLMSTFVGAILCVFDYGQDHYMLRYAKEDARIKAWAAVCYSMIAMPVGMILLNIVFKIHPKKSYFKFISQKTIFTLSDKRIKNTLIFTAFLSVLSFLYIMLNSSSWPLYSAIIEKDFISAAEGRVDVRTNFHGIIYIKNLIGLTLVPLLSYYSFVIMYTKKDTFYKVMFIIILFFTLLILSYDTQKAPIIFYSVGFIIIRVLIKGTIPLKTILIFVGVSLLVMSLLYVSFNDTAYGALDVLLNPQSAMWGRIFVSSYAGVPLSFEWFPDVITQPTWQIGIPKFILNLFDMPTTESARLLMERIDPSGNLVSSYYISEAWANYGIAGVIIAPFIVGINIQIIHIFLLKSKKTPLTIAFYALVTSQWVISSGFVNFLLFKFIISSFLIYYLAKFVIYRITIK